ncbi:MAG: DMT family transporter [Dorea formicigenerans]
MKRKRNWDNEYKSKRIHIFIAVRSLLWFYAIACESDLRGWKRDSGSIILRFALAIIPLYIYLKVRKVPMELSVEEGKKILCVTVFGYGITALLLYSAYDYMPSGMATVIHFGYPVFVLLGSLIFLRRRVPKLKIVCVGLCMIGIFLSYAGSGGEAKPMGFVFALISGMTYAFYILYLEVGGLQDIPAMKMIFYMNIVGSIMVFLIGKVSGSFVLHMNVNAWIAAFIGVGFFQYGVQYVGAQDAAILSTFEPVTSMIVGILVLHESASLSSMAGCILILISVTATAFAKS